jgi:hypothetical protein
VWLVVMEHDDAVSGRLKRNTICRPWRLIHDPALYRPTLPVHGEVPTLRWSEIARRNLETALGAIRDLPCDPQPDTGMRIGLEVARSSMPTDLTAYRPRFEGPHRLLDLRQQMARGPAGIASERQSSWLADLP